MKWMEEQLELQGRLDSRGNFGGPRIAGALDGGEGEREEGFFDLVDFQLGQSFA